MVSTSFVRETDISLRLPQAEIEAEFISSAVEVLEISITETGVYFVNGQPLANNLRRTLLSEIEMLVGSNDDIVDVLVEFLHHMYPRVDGELRV